MPRFVKWIKKKEQRYCIKYGFEFGKIAIETHEMLKIAYGEVSISRSQVFDWFGRFKNSKQSVDH